MKNRTRAALGLCLVLAAFAAACTPPTPKNVLPVAAASADVTTGEAPLTVTFSSAGSTDPDGTIASYSWDFGDSSAPSSDPDPVHVYAAAGEFTATLTVTDNHGATDSASVTITVAPEPDDPNGRYVATTGTDDNDCSVSATPCATVNYAVSQAVAGNTVYVAAGTYPEMVSVDKDLTFKGANAGVAAGTDASTRGAESVVKGFRNPGPQTGATPVGTTQIDVTIDGFRIDVQNDAALMSATLQPLVWLRGGDDQGVAIRNNVFSGADAYIPSCNWTCTGMTDAAITTYSGTVLIEQNHIENFRRNVVMTQSVGAPTSNATFTGNVVVNATSRSVAVGGVTSVQMPGATITGNVLTTGTSGAGGVVISNGGNLVDGNAISGHGSAVWIDICKKFDTRDNVITNNDLTNNLTGIYTGVSQTGACQTGLSSPSPTGGDINGLVATGNNISGNSSRGILIGIGIGWSTYTAIQPDGPIDLTCNYWGDESGPTNAAVNPAGTGDALVLSYTGTATISAIPFRTAEAPDGACDGGV